MRIPGALCLALLMLTGSGTIARSANTIRLENGKLVVAQSYCAMCANDRTTCVANAMGPGRAFKVATTITSFASSALAVAVGKFGRPRDLGGRSRAIRANSDSDEVLARELFQ